jgi:hypothetical protein
LSLFCPKQAQNAKGYFMQQRDLKESGRQLKAFLLKEKAKSAGRNEYHPGN